MEIETGIKKDGFVMNVESESGIEIPRDLRVVYMPRTWDQIPHDLKRYIVDHVSYLIVLPLAILLEERHLSFATNHKPALESFLFENLVRHIPMAATIDRVRPAKYLDVLVKAKIEYANIDPILPKRKTIEKNPKALLSLSFGKDSLASLGLALECGLEPLLFFVEEPSLPLQWEQYRGSIRRLKEDKGFNTHIVHFGPSLLRDSRGIVGKLREIVWGTETLVYAFLSLPYFYTHSPNLFLFGNQRENELVMRDEQGYILWNCFEQTNAWLLTVRLLFQLAFGENVRTASLIDPLSNLQVASLLHNRYGDLGNCQTSCYMEDPEADPGWCSNCTKCARNYIFLRALGVDPKKVGFPRDMDRESDAKHYGIFGGDDPNPFWGSLDEQIVLSFALAVRNGASGELFDKFKSDFSHYTAEELNLLIDQYFSVAEPVTIPHELKGKVLPIFNSIEKPSYFE